MHLNFLKLLPALLPLFLTGCVTNAVMDRAQRNPTGKSYQMESVTAATKLPNGDVQLTINGRLAQNRTSKFTLLIPKTTLEKCRAAHAQKHKAPLKHPKNPTDNYVGYDAITIRRTKIFSTAGTPIPIRQITINESLYNLTAHDTPVIYVRPSGWNNNDHDAISLDYVEPCPYDNGLRLHIETDAKTLANRGNPLYLALLPVALATDAVLIPAYIIKAVDKNNGYNPLAACIYIAACIAGKGPISIPPNTAAPPTVPLSGPNPR